MAGGSSTITVDNQTALTAGTRPGCRNGASRLTVLTVTVGQRRYSTVWHTLTHSHTFSDTLTHSCWKAWLHTLPHEVTHLHKLSHTRSQTFTHTLTNSHTHAHKLSHTSSQTLTHMLTNSHTHAHKLSHTRSQTLTHTLTNSHIQAHKLTHTRSQTLTRPHSITISNTRVSIWVHNTLTLPLLVRDVQRSNLGRRPALLGFLAVFVSLSTYRSNATNEAAAGSFHFSPFHFVVL